MKELMGGLWIAGLGAGALGMIWGGIALGLLGTLIGAASWYRELEDSKRAASWRQTYPSYKY